MCSWVEMRHAIGSLHHKALQQKAKDIVIHVLDEDLMTYEKLRTESEKKDEKEEETEQNNKGEKKGKRRIERRAEN